MTELLAIDPGPEQSGWCVFAGGAVVDCGISENEEVLTRIKLHNGERDSMAIEMVASYGMAVGKDVFETVRWIGRFQQCWHRPDDVELVYRRNVKLHLCGSAKAKDTNIRQALIDLIGPVGTKKEPGPLYGVKSHIWSAVAVAATSLGLRPGFEKGGTAIQEAA